MVDGSATGRGASLIIVDDYLRNYAASRSKTIKRAVLNAFKNDIMSRKAPTSIVIVIATQWAEDDLIGEIDKERGPGQTFEGFEIIRFPARKEGEWDYLFPERYPAAWYEENRRTLGPRQAAALLDCAPRPDEGGRFKPAQQVRVHDTLEAWPTAMRECRAWDLASSSKERDGDDPDWTWGVRLGITGSKATGYEVWVRSAVSGRWEAPERNAVIRQTALGDSTGIRQYVESFGAYKDAVNELKTALKGVRIVQGIRLPGDKTVKAAILEPIFDACRVHVYRGGMSAETLDRWMADFASFPEGAHDDAVDATALAVHALTAGSGSQILM
jgi:predicted phage terminase large subunit-like protein